MVESERLIPEYKAPRFTLKSPLTGHRLIATFGALKAPIIASMETDTARLPS